MHLGTQWQYLPEPNVQLERIKTKLHLAIIQDKSQSQNRMSSQKGLRRSTNDCFNNCVSVPEPNVQLERIKTIKFIRKIIYINSQNRMSSQKGLRPDAVTSSPTFTSSQNRMSSQKGLRLHLSFIKEVQAKARTECPVRKD